jgi:C-terminal processing protease CtpA/Prc
VTYRDPVTSEEKAIHARGLPRKEIQKLQRSRYGAAPSPMKAADLRFLDEGKIAVVKIHGFGGMVGFRSLRKFIDQAFQEIHDQDSKALIIDVRDNDGGAHDVAEQVFSYLADKPFLYYRDLVLNSLTFSFLPYAKPSTPIPADAVAKWPDGKFHHVTQANWGMQQPRQPHFGGKIYVLMNGGSFSSTCEFLSATRSYTKAIFIGEESGGSYSGNTSGMKYDITLPNSKLILRVPTVGYYMAAVKDHLDLDRGILPDYPIQQSIQDLLGSEDREMKKALDLARKDNSESSR